MRGLRLSRRILRAPALAAVVDREILPSPDEHISDSDLEHHARKVAKTVYHPSCTCKMGRDGMAVVDPKLRVHGVPRLRIADVSVMPELVSGNTNAPTIMIAERCADFLLEKVRSEEHTSELQSLMRISYAVFCLKQKKKINPH